eukprot:372032_1
MGNCSGRDTSTEGKLETYSKLINMGFPENISLDAGYKYPNKLNQAIDYVLKHDHETKIEENKSNLDEYKGIKHTSFSENKCLQKLDECDHVKQVILILQAFEDVTASVKHDETLISDKLNLLKTNHHRAHVMRDFVHVQQNHNKNDTDQQYYHTQLTNHCVSNNKLCDTESRHINRQKK